MKFEISNFIEIVVQDKSILKSNQFITSDLDKYIFVTPINSIPNINKNTRQITCIFYNATAGLYYGYCRVKLNAECSQITKIIKYNWHYSYKGKISCRYCYENVYHEYVHRIVYSIWLYFRYDHKLLNPALDINHKSWDGEDNSFSNLEAVSRSDNVRHARLGRTLRLSGINRFDHPTSAHDVDEFRKLHDLKLI